MSLSNLPSLQQLHQSISESSAKLGQSLANQGWLISTAESCTGGWVASSLVEIAGSSKWFHCAHITYSNEAKHRHLSVPKEILRKKGAVSQETVEAMAQGLLDLEPTAHLAVAISGVAGPTGGTDTNPIGSVWLAVKSRDNAVISEKKIFLGDRTLVRAQTVVHALSMCQNQVDNA